MKEEMPETEARRRKLCEWLKVNGLDPARIPEDAQLRVSTRDSQKVIEYEEYEFDAGGEPILTDNETDVKRARRETPLTVPPPPELRL